LKEDQLWNQYPSADHKTIDHLEEQIQAEGKKIKAVFVLLFVLI